VRVDVRARSRAAGGRSRTAAGRTRVGASLSCGSTWTIGRIDLGVAPLGQVSRGPDEHECQARAQCSAAAEGRSGDVAQRRLLMKWVLLRPDCPGLRTRVDRARISRVLGAAFRMA
jgi:hypothetical protein